MGEYAYISTIGQDSHAFGESKDCTVKLCGIDIPFDREFSANSDGDVALHAITNAVSGYTGINILGGAADKLCLEQGIKDSTVYLAEALKSMNGAEIIHCSMTIECLRPKLKEYIPAMKEKVGELLGLPATSVGITATTGEGLTGFGKGEGVQVFAILSIRKPL